MIVKSTLFTDVFVITPAIFTDERGYFFEAYQSLRYAKQMPEFVQENISRSCYGVIRGMHYQLPHSQGKLVGVTRGEVWDVIVDLRLSSPTFGKTFSIILNDMNHQQLYIPPAFAHGFCVLSEYADFYYKCTDYYTPESEKGIIWNDPDLNIEWPIQSPIISKKDICLPKLKDIPHEHLFS